MRPKLTLSDDLFICSEEIGFEGIEVKEKTVIRLG